MQTIIPHRNLGDIKDKELRDVCILSGEISQNFTIEKIERIRDEDERIRVINVTCKAVHIDSFTNKEWFELNQICINTSGIVWTVDLKRKSCDNICRRDVIANQIEVLHYLIIKGFDFYKSQSSVELFILDEKKWFERDVFQNSY